MSINHVNLTGNLTRDPDMRATPSGMPVMTFAIAVNERRKNQQTGEWENYPNFIDCTMFGTRAEAVNKHLFKGSKVALEGKLRWSQWERDGQKYSKLEVIITEIELMSSIKKSSDASSNNQAEVHRISAPVNPVVDASIYDKDIPFQFLSCAVKEGGFTFLFLLKSLKYGYNTH